MLAVLALSLQAAFSASSIGPLAQNPDFYVPQSSIPKWYEPLTAHTNHVILTGIPKFQHEPEAIPLAMHGPLKMTNPNGYWPTNLYTAYNVPPNGGTKAIAIVDAYHYATALNDFNVFSKQFGLPLESSTIPLDSTNAHFQVVYQGWSKPAVDDPGWNQEAALDIEWAHAMAPNAKIYLVEAHTNSYADLFASVQMAYALTGVSEVSMSWGGGEFNTEAMYDGTFVHKGTVFFASAGDAGGVVEYPSASPNVVGVGGTTLNMTNGVFASETAWAGSGGGPSAYETRPSYQTAISSIVGTVRGVPDIAADANPYTGVAVYDSTADDGYVGWLVFGGTSVASPVCAGITNNAGSFLTSSSAELTKIYGGLGGSNFRDIVSGTAGANTAKVGWDYITGVGSPLGIAGL